MPDLSASQLRADLASIAASIPGAVKTLTIGNASYSAIDTPATGAADLTPIGMVSTTTRRVYVSGGSLNPSTITPRETVVALGSEMLLVVGVTADPFGGVVQLILDEVGHGIG
jgi:hypothetical protein